MKLSLQRAGLLLIVLSAAGYSFFPILTKVIYDNGLVSPLDILIWRFILAAPVMWGVMAFARSRRSPPSPGEHPLPRLRLIALGMLFSVVAGSAFFALQRLPASLYTVLIYTYPTIVALGAALFGERLSARGWVALVLTLVGIVLTVPNFFAGFSGVDPLGVVLVLTNAVLYAAYILLSSRVLRGRQDLISASGLSISGSLLFGIGLVAVRGVNVPPTPPAWMGLLLLATISTVIPSATFYAGLQRIGPARASIISTIEPAMTLFWAVILLREHLQNIQVMGAVLIIASVVLLQLPAKSSGVQPRQTSPDVPVATV